MEDMKAALAAKGYDLVDQPGGDDSDSDDGLPGRIPSLEPSVAREKGNEAFKAGKYDKAIKYWQGGLKSILSSLCSGPQAMSDVSLSELDLTLNLNIAMAYMKKNDFESAERSVEKALARRDALPPHQITKALYRKASAQRSMHRLEECLETLKDLLGVEATHAAALQMQQEVDREWARQCREQKKNLKKMFSKLGDEDKEQQQKIRSERAEARLRCAVCWTEDDVNSEAFELGEAPACDGADWGMAFSRTVLWAIEQFSVEGRACLSREAQSASMWFVGASSTCELRFLQAKTLMTRLPHVQSLELVLLGFLGELDPDNKRVPDPKADGVPQGITRTKLDDGRCISLQLIKGALQDALAKELKPGSVATEPVAAEAQPGEEDAAAAAKANSKVHEGSAEVCEGTVKEEIPVEVVPPSLCIIAHPQLHRYFTDFFPALSWLIQHDVPTVVIGASEPDPSWRQDEVLLKAAGAHIVVGKRECPYPMCLPDNPSVKKCNHIIGFLGGKAVERERLTKIKLELLAQDYSVR
mmetsp:Transcript_29494/g.57828  ORF Transcript_29494/g.57828 Transcript_29494/m.57828 type:complete len:528 (-) Transcript_29494:151-1734(-)